MRNLACATLVLWVSTTWLAAQWTLKEGTNPELPGRKVDIHQDGRLVARFIFGEEQLKPYLHVFSPEGDCLTEWSSEQRYPHHRGIFIGWNRISSELGTYDLWHLNNGGKMKVVKLDRLEGGPENATLVAQVAWRAGKSDSQKNDQLLTETRTLVISRKGNRTQVDARFVLQAVRDLTLGGDLQHAGVHFRSAHAVVAREKETAYVWEPDLPGPGGKVVSPDLKWCYFTFPLRDRWYSATQLNAPGNPTEELSWRAYGRFGFFFKKQLKTGEKLALDYRFLLEPGEAPAKRGQLSTDQVGQIRARVAEAYRTYAGSRR